MFRRNGLILLAIIFVIFIIIPTIIMDSLTEMILENYLSVQMGARVEIQGLDISIPGSKIKLDRLEITNPDMTMENIIETGLCSIELDLSALLSRSILIPRAEFQDVQFHTERMKDGRIEKVRIPEEPDKPVPLNTQKDNKKVLVGESDKIKDRIDVETLIAEADMKTPGKIDSLKSVYADTYLTWQTKLELMPDEEEINAIGDRIKKIDVRKVKSVTELKSINAEISSINTDIHNISEAGNKLRTLITDQINEFKKHPDLINKWIESDYQNISDKIESGEFSNLNLAQSLFGKDLINKIDKLKNYLRYGRKYYSAFHSNDKKENLPRGLGQDIQFAEDRKFPLLWIQNLDLSSSDTQDVAFITGSIHDITTNQNITQEPTTINLTGKDKGFGNYLLNGIIRYGSDHHREDFKLTTNDISMEGTRFTGLPYPLKSGKGNLVSSISSQDDSLNVFVDFSVKEIKFATASGKNNSLSGSAVWTLMKDITGFSMTAQIENTPASSNINISSSLDEMFKNKLSEIRKSQRAQVNSELQDRKNQSSKKYKDELSSELSNYETQILAQIGVTEEEYREKLNQLNQIKNELEKSVTKKQKKDIENKIKKIFR